MKTLQTILLTACMLTVTTVYAQAQEGLQISTLFEKYGNRDSVTMLLSAYYQLSAVKRKGRKTRRYILFKRNRTDMATLIYIEGPLTESDLMDMLRDSADMRVRK